MAPRRSELAGFGGLMIHQLTDGGPVLPAVTRPLHRPGGTRSRSQDGRQGFMDPPRATVEVSQRRGSSLPQDGPS